jgi:DNA (cytosine-5)-methyltransferase 1
MELPSVEMCAGAGGQALGLELAGFRHEALVEIERPFCDTLRLNRPRWNICEGDLSAFDGRPYQGVDLLAGGLPCPPFSVAGKQLGVKDERNLFPEALRLVDEIRPRALMIENVRGFLDAVFEDYRLHLKKQLKKLGYEARLALTERVRIWRTPASPPRGNYRPTERANREFRMAASCCA